MSIEDRLKDDIVFFCETMFKDHLGWEDRDTGIRQEGLADYQKDLLHAFMTYRHVVACYSRQIGKTSTIIYAIIRMLCFETNFNIGIYAPTYDHAVKEFFTRLRLIIENSPILMDVLQPEIKKDGEIYSPTTGNRLRCFTANKDSKSLRGFPADLMVMDEVQDIVDDIYFGSIIPSGSAIKHGRKSRIWETGTPGKRNHFHESVQHGVPLDRAQPGDFLVKSIIPYTECPFIDLDLVGQAEKIFPRAKFEAEYMCKWDFDTGFAFDWDDVDNACIGHTQRHFPRTDTGLYVGGIDLGRNRDHTVITILKWQKPVWWMVYHKEYDLGLSWEEILRDLEHEMAYWQPNYTVVDKTGIGDVMFETFFEMLPWSIEGFLYTMDSKIELIQKTQRVLEREHLWMFDDTQLVKQFKDLEEDRHPSGKPRYKKPDKRHDDRVQSVALAVWAGWLYLGEGDGEPNIVGNTPTQLSTLFKSDLSDAEKSVIKGGKKRSRWDKWDLEGEVSMPSEMPMPNDDWV